MGKVLIIKGADFSAVAVGQVEIGTRINVAVNPEGGGAVSGGGCYDEGEQVNLVATPASGYKFSQWSDGNTSASRTITVGSSPTTYTAYFVVGGKREITRSDKHDGMTEGSVGETISYDQESTFRDGTYIYDIPANSTCIIEEIATGGDYPFKLARASDNIIVESVSNISISDGEHTFTTQSVACKLYASRAKLGKVYIDD